MKPGAAIFLEEEHVNRLLRKRYPILLLCASLVVAGCGHAEGQHGGGPPMMQEQEVEVCVPVAKQVTDYEYFPGRTDAVNSIDIRARVTGYLDKVNFKEGMNVKQGDLLFQIDPRPYQSSLANAQAGLVQAEAHLKRLELDYNRAVDLLPRHAIGREEFDKISGDRAEAQAAVGVAKANRQMAALNMEFTQVRAPISGRISRRNIDPGNLVKADDTVLTSIVSLDPMYAYFDLDERTTLRLQQLIKEGKLDLLHGKIPVQMGTANDADFPQSGIIDFADNRVDPDTGTWRLRGRFDNPYHLISSGLFVRIRLPVGDPFRAILIPEQAIGTDQGQKFVYVVNGHNQVEYRRVKVGQFQDGLRVISGNLKEGEKVVVSGLQRVREGAQVKPVTTTWEAIQKKAADNTGK